MEEAASPGSGAMKRLRELMIPLEEYPWVRIDDTLGHAVRVIEAARLEVGQRASLPRVLLVFDHDDDLVGIVRRRDILRGLEPSLLVDQPLEYRAKLFEVAADPHLAELSSELSKEVTLDRVVKGLRDQANRPVEDVLRPIPASLGPDDQVMKAVYDMVSLNQSLIPVVEDDKVIGVVRSVDVFHELALLLE
ncbi:MAG: CBS domain-containing protein [Gemmatimonadota bacterium]|jgi:predicted transcriptional regulator